MAKYNITYACGHTGDVQIGGKTRDRDRRAEYEATKLCYACYTAKLATERSAKNDLARTEATEAGLPELTGSDKQIAWSMSIRKNVLDQLEAQRSRINRCGEFAYIADMAIDSLRAKYLANVSAKWWIETGRSIDILKIERDLADEIRLVNDPAWQSRLDEITSGKLSPADTDLPLDR